MASPANPVLSCRETGPDDAPALLLLHGVLGSRQNLLPLARCLGEIRHCYLLDLPGHGASDWLPSYSYTGLVHQLLTWADAHGLQAFDILGHSLGGRLAMGLALTVPERVRSVQVLDITPRATGEDSLDVLQAMAAVDLQQAQTRADVDQALAARIVVPEVRQFAMTNLRRDEAGRLAWRVDLQGLLQAWDTWRAWPWYGQVADQMPAQILYGANSTYIDAEGLALCKAAFPQIEIHTIADAGHWLHAEQPAAVCQLVQEFLVL